MKNLLILILFSLISFDINSQKILFPINPGKQNYLSGNLGELRGDHFHMGLDIRTGGKINLPVYAVESGYVERVRVSGTGYGKALYLKHENGLKSVYAHLNSFVENINTYVLDQQYKKQSFIVNLYPSKKFYFNKGDIIGYSGNSGSSGGPHLHFELRDNSDKAINPLNFKFKEIEDDVNPLFNSISFKTLNNNSRVNDKFGIFNYKTEKENNIHINLKGEVGISVQSFDKLSNASNKVGIYNYILIINDSILVNNKIDTLSYSETNDVSWFVDQNLFNSLNYQFVKLYQDDGNNLSFHKNNSNGIIEFKEDTYYKIELIIYDSFNNNSSFFIHVNMNNQKLSNLINIDLFNNNYYILDNTLVLRSELQERDFIEIKHNNVLDGISYSYSDNIYKYYLIDLRKTLPEKALLPTSEINFNFITSLKNEKLIELDNNHLNLIVTNDNIFDTLYIEFVKQIDTIEKFIFKNSLPLKKNISITLKPLKKYNLEKSGVYDITNSPLYIGGTWIEENISFNTNFLSKYAILEDEEKPKIEILKFNKEEMKFRIYDTLSGIKSYEAKLNGKWLLFEYDNKNDLIISKKRYPNKSFTGKFVIEVFDNANNKNSLELSL